MTTENIGEIVIAPRVLEVITGIAATKVEGVYALQNKNVTDSLSKTSLGRDRKSTRLNSSHSDRSRMPSSA